MGNNFTLESNNSSDNLPLFNSNGTTCDSECQRQQKLKELEQKYVNAKSNLATAPSEYETAKKNYFIELDGSVGYNAIQGTDLTSKATKIATTLQDNFNKSYHEASILLESYSGVYINLNNIFDLLKNYMEENKSLMKKVKNTTSDIVTNDRKTYYEDQSIDHLKKYYKWMKYLYYFILIIYLICIFLVPPQVSRKKEIIIFIILFIYPFVIGPIWRFIMKVFYKIKNVLPKNVYKSLGPVPNNS